MNVDPEAHEAARAKLKAAIDEYYEVIYPGSYIDDWLVVVHRQSIKLEEHGLSTVSTTIPPGQALYRSMGLFDQAIKSMDDESMDIDEEDLE
ncbi:hypothetical protein SEA_CICADA_2 [Microbacterium phage Cicada]|nr:hypothetical protein SEA_CICADA_2 [Microbacterium phage Cicada]